MVTLGNGGLGQEKQDSASNGERTGHVLDELNAWKSGLLHDADGAEL